VNWITVGKGREGKEREGKEGKGKGMEGKGGEGRGREGKEREGKEREGKEREGKGEVVGHFKLLPQNSLGMTEENLTCLNQHILCYCRDSNEDIPNTSQTR
jgi:hypothetical protein